MVHDIKKYFSVFLQMQKINVMGRMAYPLSFIIIVFTTVFVGLADVLFINVAFRSFPEIAGWQYHQALLVVGTYMIIDGLMWSVFGQLNSINTHIFEGTFDGIMLKPIDSQFFVSIWRGDVEDAVKILSGTSLIIFASSNLHILSLGHILDFLVYIFMLINGLLIFYSLNILIRSATFWIIDGRGLWTIMDSMSRTNMYPTDIFNNKVLRMALTFVVPMFFIATVPAKVLAFGFSWSLLGGSFLAAGASLFVSRKFWNLAVGHYSSSSS